MHGIAQRIERIWYGGAPVPALLAAHDRRALPSVTAPPEGLALARVEYAADPGQITFEM